MPVLVLALGLDAFCLVNLIRAKSVRTMPKLTFAIAVTALAAALARTTLAVVGIAFVVLLALPVLGTVHVLERWLPSALVDAPVALVNGTHELGYFWPALAVAAAATVAALAAATARLRAREV